MTDYYDADLLAAMAHVITSSTGDFYVFRHPGAPLPPLRFPSTIHRISRHVPPHRLFLVDITQTPVIQQLTAA